MLLKFKLSFHIISVSLFLKLEHELKRFNFIQLVNDLACGLKVGEINIIRLWTTMDTKQTRTLAMSSKAHPDFRCWATSSLSRCSWKHRKFIKQKTFSSETFIQSWWRRSNQLMSASTEKSLKCEQTETLRSHQNLNRIDRSCDQSLLSIRYCQSDNCGQKLVEFVCFQFSLSLCSVGNFKRSKVRLISRNKSVDV